MQIFSKDTSCKILAYAFSFMGLLALPCTLMAQNFSSEYVVVRLKNHAENTRTSSLENLKKTHPVNLRQAIHWSDPKTRGKHSLSDIYLVDIPDGISLNDWLETLEKSNAFEYAEPYIEHELLYTPNDPQAAIGGAQDYLAVIKAYDAWSITRGSNDIIIGILDSGTKTDHEDLSPNVAVNPNDPINGIDDDQDGYIDNYWGWDMADKDNNPSPGISGHGTFVTGVASAKADNAKGMAGIGFNSPHMPIKIYRSSDNRFLGGYEAIAYAADMGCKVINLSWGSAGNYLQYAQDIINYAVLQKNVVIVAAAGNTNADLDFYPASYDNVLSVGATTVQDVKAVWATYSNKIDLVAPGDVIYSTNVNGSYSKDNGSSFAAPMVAGAAALVRARFPNLSAQQVMERIRVTADDNIYMLPGNQTYIDKLGKGRLNMYRALTDEGIKSVRITGFSAANRFGAYAFAGDTLDLSLQIKNWLSEVDGLKVSIESMSSEATIDGATQDVGNLTTLASAALEGRFKVVVKDLTPASTRIDLKVVFDGNGYQDYQYISLYTSPTSVIISNNLSQISVNQNGQIGNGAGSESGSNGIFHSGKKIIDHIGLIVATTTQKVSDNAIVRFDDQIISNDLESQHLLQLHQDSPAYLDIRNTFKEKSSLTHKTGILIEQKLLAWPDQSDKNSWVIEYRITNTTSSPISNVYLGNLMDVNIGDQTQNKTDYQASRKMLYSYGVDGGPIYAALAPLSTSPFTAMALDLGSFNVNLPDVNNQIDDAIKYNLLQQGEGLGKTQAGANSLGNDVATLLGNKIANLPAYGSIKLAYVYVSGNSLDNLEDGFDEAKNNYNQYLDQPPLLQTLYACPNTSISIDPIHGDRFDFYADKNLSQKLFTGNQFLTGNLNQDTVFYIQNVDNLYKSDIAAIRVLVKDAIADFSIPSDTLLLPAQGGADIQLTDLSENVSIWQWQFGNGFQSSVKNPKITFSQSGNYNISLTAKTAWGCEDFVQKPLVVLRRAAIPELADEIRICSDTQATIEALNTSQIKVYADAQKQVLLYEGQSFLTNHLTNDVVFYVSNMDGEAESELKSIRIDVLLLTADFLAVPDTTNLESRSVFQIINQSINGHTFEWYLDNEFKSSESDPYLDFEGLADFDLKMVTFSESGCSTENSIHFDNASSPLPQVEGFSVCPDRPFTIAPENSGIFYFYADPSREHLLYKGIHFATNIQKDSTFYISNADGLIESALVPIHLQTLPVDATIMKTSVLSQDPNIIALGSHTLMANDQTAHDWLWHINGQIVSTKSSFDYNFVSEGEYTIRLSITTQDACKGSSEEIFLVDKVTGVAGNLSYKINVYPNPTKGWVAIELPDGLKDLRITITSAAGSEVYSSSIIAGSSKATLNLQHLPSGLYFLKIESEGKIGYRKLQIEK